MVDRAIDKLLAMLRTDDPPVGRDTLGIVVKALRTYDDELATSALAEALADADPEYRCTAAEVFLNYDVRKAIPHLSRLLKDEESAVRGFVCMELGAYRNRAATPLLIDVLQTDPDGTHRVYAAWGLGNIGDPQALPALRQAMQDDDGVDYEGRPVKSIAAEAIRRITQEKATASVA